MPDILLIDDNRHFQFGLASNLRRAGYDVAVASSGDEGVKLARETRPELILCDIKMPGMDGLGVKRALNDEIATADIPFIFLSALSTPKNKSKGLLAGADDYIAKPFDMEELIARIQSVLRREARAEIRSRTEVQQLLENLITTLPLHTSHPFRTHLGILLLSLNAIKDNPAGSETCLDYAKISTYRLKILVNSLIWLNEYDLGRFETMSQQLNLELSLLLPLQEIHELWKEKNLQLDMHVDDGAGIIAPGHSFTLAVCHLMDNACKFSPEGGRVQVRLKSYGINGCELTVQDEGPGIPMDLRQVVFDRFRQNSNEIECSQNHGMGLGLYLARSFARTRSGDVRILDSAAGCSVQMILKSTPSDPANF